jgi:hypothetical protein
MTLLGLLWLATVLFGASIVALAIYNVLKWMATR